VGTLRQVEIKRFLAYGSITHVGFLLSGDLLSSFTYLASYLAASFLFFTILLQLRLNNKEIIYLSDLRFLNRSSGQSYRTFLVVSLASMAGLPPFAGFYGKMMI
jgi:NADH-quinone oxidoreductase subunit N